MAANKARVRRIPLGSPVTVRHEAVNGSRDCRASDANVLQLINEALTRDAQTVGHVPLRKDVEIHSGKDGVLQQVVIHNVSSSAAPAMITAMRKHAPLSQRLTDAPRFCEGQIQLGVTQQSAKKAYEKNVLVPAVVRLAFALLVSLIVLYYLWFH